MSESEFEPGMMVRLVARPETIGAVVSSAHGPGQTQYGVFHDSAVHTYFASQIEQLARPSAATRVTAPELHAALTATLLLDENSDYLHARNAGRIDFEPYQYRPVLKLVQADRPRILIADDVGVGKTIEACLILKELQARGRADSVLVVCPKPLVVDEKWRSELQRFDEDFVHLDSKTLRWCLEETAREGEWPSRYRKAILPYSLLDETLLTGTAKGRKRQQGLDDLIGDIHFDLLVVDEAHHVRNPETKAYQNVQRLVAASEAVVMLSATPIQLKSRDLFTLVNLLRDDLVPEPADFDAMLEPNGHLHAAALAARAGQDGWSHEVATHVARATATAWGRDVLGADPRVEEIRGTLTRSPIQDRDRVRVIRLVESLNTFSEIVTRTRRRDIGEFTTRKPSAPEVDFTPEQQAVYDATIELGARIAEAKTPGIPIKFLLSTLLRQAASSVTGLAPLIEDVFENRLRGAETSGETDDVALTSDEVEAFRSEIRGLQHLAAELIGAPDPKVDLLRQIVEGKAQDAKNKVLVFSTFRHTIAYLRQRCGDWDVRVGVMHGGIPDDVRFDVRRRFKLDRADPDAYDVLLCSEIGTEGLDYQFCDTLVNYDIPWNPMRIEQRIGRIDRRGQKSEAVAIINLLTRGTIEAEIYDRCFSRIGVFNHALGGSEQILGEITEAVVDIATSLRMTAEERRAALRQISDNQIARIEEEQRLEDQQADLLGYAGKAFVDDIADASSEWLEETKMANLVRRFFESAQPGRSIALRPGRVAKIPLSSEVSSSLLADLEGRDIGAVRLKRHLRGDKVILSLTTDPVLAEESQDIELLGPMHPLARLAAEVARPAGTMEATVRVVSDRVPAGRYPVGIYSWTRLGVRDALTLRFVATSQEIEYDAAMLVSAAVSDGESDSISADDVLELGYRHAELWRAARLDHQRRHEDAVDRRIAALTSQKNRRLTEIQRRVDSATHPDIATMRLGELRAAEAAYDKLLDEQRAARNRADLKTTHVADILLEVAAP
ncbi:DEAD/DEAH box helicase [Nocardioides campestrisoli]|uniref:DEAD/DEAH box helicase n=1 Tax=Nocardioides campestrisoli TaxID=2736757 RepID=UPI0015E7ADAA|nr:SNF2-related protein [Nocardioides campestrisoli]